MANENKKLMVLCILMFILMLFMIKTTGLRDSELINRINERINENDSKGKIKVIVWNTILQDWVQQVLGNLGTVESIVTGDQDIHSYEYTASDIEKVINADIFIKMGIVGVEPHADDLILAALPDNPNLINYTLLNSTIDPINGIKIQYDPLIGSNNPHIWMSPYNAKKLINVTYLKLSEFNSTLEPQFRANRDAYFKQLDGLITRINGYKILFNNTPIVSNHPAYMYLFNLLGIQRVGVIEEHEG
ncbi:MAG: metal ABC transporter substrate-binding protein, partial [Candidatus Helarchaeota archaeon]